MLEHLHPKENVHVKHEKQCSLKIMQFYKIKTPQDMNLGYFDLFKDI